MPHQERYYSEYMFIRQIIYQFNFIPSSIRQRAYDISDHILTIAQYIIHCASPVHHLSGSRVLLDYPAGLDETFLFLQESGSTRHKVCNKGGSYARADRSSHTRHYISPGPLIQMDTDNNNVHEETLAKNRRYKHGRLSTIVIYKAK